ncbi:oligosaccharide repeat unit polymerase [Enterococcus faecium]|nr:oligosaccharide repeat unit polymerase [Enterococcus faecium]EGP5667742.1 oligosaccharide repeat unit polymerase [Enterococcus faecium]
MIKFIGILLGLFFLLMLYIYYQKEKDFLEPKVLFLILEFISYVPGMILFTSESSIEFTVAGCMKVMLFELIYVFSALAGINLSRKIFVAEKNKVYDIPLINIIIFFAIGFGAKILVILKLGGLSFVIQNGELAYLMQAHGYGIYTMFYKFMVVAILAMFEKFVIHKERRVYKVLLIVMISLYALSFLIYTNRTPAFIVVLITFFIYNFEIRRMNLSRVLNLRVILVVVLLVFLAYTATLRRTENSNKVSQSMWGDLFYNYTNVGRDIKVYDYFSDHEKWLGKGYLNIIPSLIPGTKSKPSTDDGIYLVNIIRGNDIDINANSDELPSQTGSVPFTTPGYMYANFGFVGVLLGGIIEGFLIGLSYKKMQKNKNAFNVAIYFYMIYSFGLSTGRMVPTMISIIFIWLFKKVINIRVKVYR